MRVWMGRVLKPLPWSGDEAAGEIEKDLFLSSGEHDLVRVARGHVLVFHLNLYLLGSWFVSHGAER